MDPIQVIIAVSVLLITGIIIACGVALFNILKELKFTVVKTNQILDDTKLITQSVAAPVSSLSEFVMGFKNGFNFFNTLFNKKKENA